jgi:uncharacterized membrane protein (UPF0127 family)
VYGSSSFEETLGDRGMAFISTLKKQEAPWKSVFYLVLLDTLFLADFIVRKKV